MSRKQQLRGGINKNVAETIEGVLKKLYVLVKDRPVAIRIKESKPLSIPQWEEFDREMLRTFDS